MEDRHRTSHAGPASDFAARCREELERARALLPALVEVEGERTVANTLDLYNEMLMHAERTAGMAGLMSAVHPDEAVREIARTCEQEVDSFMSALRLDRRPRRGGAPREPGLAP